MGRRIKSESVAYRIWSWLWFDVRLRRGDTTRFRQDKTTRDQVQAWRSRTEMRSFRRVLAVVSVAMPRIFGRTSIPEPAFRNERSRTPRRGSESRSIVHLRRGEATRFRQDNTGGFESDRADCRDCSSLAELFEGLSRVSDVKTSRNDASLADRGYRDRETIQIYRFRVDFDSGKMPFSHLTSCSLIRFHTRRLACTDRREEHRMGPSTVPWGQSRDGTSRCSPSKGRPCRGGCSS